MRVRGGFVVQARFPNNARPRGEMRYPTLADGPFYDDLFEVETDVILARFGVNFRF